MELKFLVYGGPPVATVRGICEFREIKDNIVNKSLKIILYYIKINNNHV